MNLIRKNIWKNGLLQIFGKMRVASEMSLLSILLPPCASEVLDQLVSKVWSRWYFCTMLGPFHRPCNWIVVCFTFRCPKVLTTVQRGLCAVNFLDSSPISDLNPSSKLLSLMKVLESSQRVYKKPWGAKKLVSFVPKAHIMQSPHQWSGNAN